MNQATYSRNRKRPLPLKIPNNRCRNVSSSKTWFESSERKWIQDGSTSVIQKFCASLWENDAVLKFFEFKPDCDYSWTVPLSRTA